MKTYVSFLVGVSLLLSLSVQVAFAQEEFGPKEPNLLEAMPDDGKVTLTWEAASAEAESATTGYYIYYGRSSATDDNPTYEFPKINAGDVTEYTISSLTNGTAYYFALTAYDSEGRESEFYSVELSATPKASATSGEDTVAPTVSSAEAVSNTLVKVVFSEAVSLPATNPEDAFTIEDTLSGEILPVTEAELDPDDTAGKTVLLTTDVQEEGKSYIVTAGIDIEDAAENQVASGESDTASFSGKGADEPDEPVEPTDTTPPVVEDAQSISSTQVSVEFSEAVVFDASNFSIVEEDDVSVSLTVYSAASQDDGKTVILTTEEQAGETDYLLTVTGVTDKAGNIIAATSSAKASFSREADAGIDTTAPEDVTSLAIKVENGVATITWKASENSAGDLASYTIYVSTDDGKTYDAGITVDPDELSYERAVSSTVNYTFKVTASDNTGNESIGVTSALCLECPEEEEEELPETGPGMLGLLVASTLAGAYFAHRKKMAV